MDELGQLEHVSIERFTVPPSEAHDVEIRLADGDQLPDGEFERHLLTHVSNTYEGRFIKRTDFLCFEFYGRSLFIQVSKINTFPNIELHDKMQNMNLNDELFFHISSSTTWSITNNHSNDNIPYPLSDVGGLTDVYEKIMKTIQNTKYQSKHY